MLSFPKKLFSSPSIKEGYKSRPLLYRIFLFFRLPPPQELPSSDISNLLNMSLSTNHSFEEDEKMLVLRHTELYINFSYNNIFSLLYKFLVMQVHRRKIKIRLIECNAKCRHLKNCPVKGLCCRCLSVWGPEPHTPPPLTHCIRVYSILIHKGKDQKGRELNQRED
jgi:hypothetical protein